MNTYIFKDSSNKVMFTTTSEEERNYFGNLLNESDYIHSVETIKGDNAKEIDYLDSELSKLTTHPMNVKITDYNGNSTKWVTLSYPLLQLLLDKIR